MWHTRRRKLSDIVQSAEKVKPVDQPGRSLPSVAQRIKFFITGVLFPAGCFVLGATGSTPMVDAPWQSGRLADKVAMLLMWPGFAPFLPLVIFSAICLSLYVFRPRCARRQVIRVGLYAGVVLSFQFFVMVLITSSYFTMVGAVFVGPGLAIAVWLLVKFFARMRRFGIRHVMILTTCCAIIGALLIMSGARQNPEAVLDVAAEVVGGVLLYILIAAPTLNLITYAHAAVRVSASSPEGIAMTRFSVGAAISWIVAWSASWGFAVDIMLREYAKLPTTDPNCYISGAAAGGHAKLVGSRQCGAGKVNLQMQRLKFLEFALAAALPRTHVTIRAVYNVIGPPLAKRCAKNVWFADTTYVALKLIEWPAEWLRRFAKVPRHRVERIYYGD